MALQKPKNDLGGGLIYFLRAVYVYKFKLEIIKMIEVYNDRSVNVCVTAHTAVLFMSPVLWSEFLTQQILYWFWFWYSGGFR